MRRNRHLSLSAGMTLLELLITITLIMIMVGFAGFNYAKIVEEQRVGKAANECHEFVKALKAWENKKGVPIREYVTEDGRPQITCPSCKRLPDAAPTCKYCGVALPVRHFLLEDLMRENIVKTLPDDPWSVQYSIDTTRGVIFSCGPDNIPNTADDIAVPFRPVFEAMRAFQDVPANAVVVEFSRALERSTITSANIVISTASAPTVDVVTLTVDLTDPYRVKGKLKLPWPKTNFLIKVNPAIKARDGSPLDITHIPVVSTTGVNPPP